MQPDFSRLYTQLDLTPDCGLEELKRAYRRRIAELHPDRASPAGMAGKLMMPISDLNSIYSQALRFHRAHGRLPGARAQEPAIPGANPPSAEISFPAYDPVLAHSNEEKATSPRHGAILVALGLVLVLMWVAYSGSASDQSADPAVAGPVPKASVRAESPHRRHTLEAGMSPESVRAVLGEPVTIRGDEWDYGPSWIRFESGKLAQWHSSPLNPLVVKSKVEAETASTH